MLLSAGLMAVRPVAAQVDVLTHRYNNARSGANLNETILNKSNVNKMKFGKLVFRNVDGNIYAQPLIVSKAGILNQSNEVKQVDVVIVATESNSVWAFDTNDTSADADRLQVTQKKLWHTTPQDLGQPVPYQTLNQTIQNHGCVDLTTEIGITGTPVIKLTPNTAPKQGVIFAAAKSMGGNPFTYKLFALNLADGKPLSSGMPIVGAVPGPNGTISFDPNLQLNRPALLLDQNVLYIAFGSHCDTGNYRGWVFAYDVSNPSAPKQLNVFSSTFMPRAAGTDDGDGRGGLWMSGHGPVAIDGSIYFTTGDGSYNVANPNFRDLANSVVKVKLVNGKIEVEDWYAPQNAQNSNDPNQFNLKKFDLDLGSGGPVPVPNSHLLLAAGKEGRMYLIDRNDMGRGNKLALHSFQVTNPPQALVAHPMKAMDALFWNIHGAPVVWPLQNQMFVYVMGEEDFLKQYRLIPDAGPEGWKFVSDKPFRKSKESVGLPPAEIRNDPSRTMVFMPGGFLTISASGTDAKTGIVWATMPYAENANLHVVRGALRAFDASDVQQGQLWGSEDSRDPNHPNDRPNSLGFFAKYNPPVVANGKVFVTTFHQENVDNNDTTKHTETIGGLLPALVIYGLK